MKKAVGYVRCSLGSDRQVNSLEVQKALISNFASQHGYEVVSFYSDEETGTNITRAGLNNALTQVESQKDCFLITKGCDRLARTSEIWALISNCLDKIRFIEMGDMQPNLFLCSVLIAAAQHEVEMTSLRLRQTFAHLKEQGRVFGNPEFTTKVSPLGRQKLQNQAAAFNNHIQKVVSDLRKAGYSTQRQLTQRLNELGILTRRQRPWSQPALSRVLNYQPQAT